MAQVPVAWIDSEAASTVADQQPYLTMIKSVVKMYRKYLPQNAKSETFAQFIESLDETTWNKLVNNVPPEITNQACVDLSDYKEVSVSDLAAALT